MGEGDRGKRGAEATEATKNQSPSTSLPAAWAYHLCRAGSGACVCPELGLLCACCITRKPVHKSRHVESQ